MRLRKPKRLTSKQRELNAHWQWVMSKYPPTGAKPAPLPEQPVYRRETPKVCSFVGVVDPSMMSKKESPVYTGSKMLGVGTMHKSNSIPIFSEEQAVEVSTMRRG